MNSFRNLFTGRNIAVAAVILFSAFAANAVVTTPDTLPAAKDQKVVQPDDSENSAYSVIKKLCKLIVVDFKSRCGSLESFCDTEKDYNKIRDSLVKCLQSTPVVQDLNDGKGDDEGKVMTDCEQYKSLWKEYLTTYVDNEDTMIRQRFNKCVDVEYRTLENWTKFSANIKKVLGFSQPDPDPLSIDCSSVSQDAMSKTIMEINKYRADYGIVFTIGEPGGRECKDFIDGLDLGAKSKPGPDPKIVDGIVPSRGNCTMVFPLSAQKSVTGVVDGSAIEIGTEFIRIPNIDGTYMVKIDETLPKLARCYLNSADQTKKMYEREVSCNDASACVSLPAPIIVPSLVSLADGNCTMVFNTKATGPVDETGSKVIQGYTGSGTDAPRVAIFGINNATIAALREKYKGSFVCYVNKAGGVHREGTILKVNEGKSGSPFIDDSANWSCAPDARCDVAPEPKKKVTPPVPGDDTTAAAYFKKCSAAGGASSDTYSRIAAGSYPASGTCIVQPSAHGNPDCLEYGKLIAQKAAGRAADTSSVVNSMTRVRITGLSVSSALSLVAAYKTAGVDVDCVDPSRNVGSKDICNESRLKTVCK